MQCTSEHAYIKILKSTHVILVSVSYLILFNAIEKLQQQAVSNKLEDVIAAVTRLRYFPKPS